VKNYIADKPYEDAKRLARCNIHEAFYEAWVVVVDVVPRVLSPPLRAAAATRSCGATSAAGIPHGLQGGNFGVCAEKAF